MITFVDTNVLLDIFLPDPNWGEKSTAALGQAFDEGSLVMNEIIYAELAPQFPTKHLLDSTLLRFCDPYSVSRNPRHAIKFP